jgi:hypothetical protein
MLLQGSSSGSRGAGCCARYRPSRHGASSNHNSRTRCAIHRWTCVQAGLRQGQHCRKQQQQAQQWHMLHSQTSSSSSSSSKRGQCP